MKFDFPNPKPGEQKNERVLSKQEVQKKFQEIIIEPFKELISRDDADGLFFLTVEVVGEIPGETIEYLYIRKTIAEDPCTAVTTIQKVFYEDGFPVGGTTVANFIDNAWVEEK
jgi:predicted transcriptional regulator